MVWNFIDVCLESSILFEIGQKKSGTLHEDADAFMMKFWWLIAGLRNILHEIVGKIIKNYKKFHLKYVFSENLAIYILNYKVKGQQSQGFVKNRLYLFLRLYSVGDR